MESQEKLLSQIQAVLEHEPRVNLHRFPVSLALDSEGSVIVEGEVESIAAKKTALRRVAEVTGVAAIVDRLRVAAPRAMGDGEIRDHLRDALIGEPALGNYGIRVRNDEGTSIAREPAPGCSDWIEISVDAGVATLTGQAGSLSHKSLAGALAWWVPGSRDVVNGLEVVPPVELDDREINDAVCLILDKDPLINANRVRVRTAGAVVTLEGLVANQTEAEMAEMDAWCTFGVDSVTNLLETL